MADAGQNLPGQNTPQIVPGDDLASQIAAAMIRHSASGLAGLLVAAGAVDRDQQSQFATLLAGVGIWVAAAAWSAFQKWRMHRGVAG